MSASPKNDSRDQQTNPYYAAVARTFTRSIALYFSRPVRLFRPSKVSGWQTLKSLATLHGRTLNSQYLTWLVRNHGLMVIPKHFVPPMIVNGVLGVVLWTTYSEVSDALQPHLATHPTLLAAISGACAGGMQAFVAAPAENVRFRLEGSSPAAGWSHAWKEVFRGTVPQANVPREAQVREARQVREWMKEVGEMAGRGWDGWGWGLAKDVCGFAVFFAIFDVTRRVATHTKAAAQSIVRGGISGDKSDGSLRKHVPRVAHAATLVSGGVVAGLAYELSSRPWDIARKAVHIDHIGASTGGRDHSFTHVILQKLRQDGVLSFFKNPSHVPHDKSIPPLRRSLYSLARTLARVGPWGVGFLVWEGFGPGIS